MLAVTFVGDFLTGSSVVEAAGATPGVVIKLSTSASADGFEIYSTFSNTAGKRVTAASEAGATKLQLISAIGEKPGEKNLPGYGCDAGSFNSKPSKPGPWAAIVSRGECTYTQKAFNAQQNGAALIIISNNVPALYRNATAKWLKQPCVSNCALSSADDEATCAASSSCPSRKCVQNPRTQDKKGGWCCFLDELHLMSINSTVVRIPTLFISDGNGARLGDALSKAPVDVKVWTREYSTIDFSIVLIFLIGVGTTAFAAYKACEPYRAAAYRRGSSEPSHQQVTERGDDEEDEEVEITKGLALCFLVMATVGLVLIFLLSLKWPHAMVIILNVLFMLGCISPLKRIFLKPLLSICAPKSAKTQYVLFRDTCMEWQAQLIDFCSLFIAAAMSVTWFCGRHSTWAWVIQDFLAVAIICVFLMTIRLPNLKIGALILGLFFVYDIFMVFISPLVFGGKSVMLEVATAGKGTSQVENHECVRVQEERMPMLFLVPRFSWAGAGTYSMLGLGDVVFPGLLVTMALRYDYAEIARRGGPRMWQNSRLQRFLGFDFMGYFPALIIAYACGLITTFAALLLDFTIFNVKGQPALLYLVPFTVGTFMAVAKCRGELSDVWNVRWSEEDGAVPLRRMDGQHPGTPEASKRPEDSGFDAPHQVPSLERRRSTGRTNGGEGGSAPLLAADGLA